MTSDRYLKGVLTVIAASLVYLCLVLTPWPTAAAAAAAAEQTECVIVGWKASDSRFSYTQDLGSNPLPVVVQTKK